MKKKILREKLQKELEKESKVETTETTKAEKPKKKVKDASIVGNSNSSK